SPAARSVVNISERAVESQSVSALPDRFLNPNTATERRACTGELADSARCLRARLHQPATVIATTIGIASAIHRHGLCAAIGIWPVLRRSRSLCSSRADW